MIQEQRNEMELQGYPSKFLIFFYLLKHFARIISLDFFFYESFSDMSTSSNSLTNTLRECFSAVNNSYTPERKHLLAKSLLVYYKCTLSEVCLYIPKSVSEQ